MILTRLDSKRTLFLLCLLLLLQSISPTQARAVETEVDLANFSVSIKGSKTLTPKSGQVSTKAVVGEKGRFCTFIYVLDIAPKELEKLQSNPLENFEYLVGSGTDFKDVTVKGFSSIKSLCNDQKKSLVFTGSRAIPAELGWKMPMKSGSYIYVAVLGFSNDPQLGKFAIPSRIVAVSDFIKVKVKL